MEYGRLEKNVMEAIEEQQMKLGFLEETVRLYYPLSSLNRFLDVESGIEEMKRILQGFQHAVKGRLGEVVITNKGERFCIAVPPAGAEYVHCHLDEEGFLARLVRTVGINGCTFNKVLEVFCRYSDHVHVEKMKNGEFDYLLYFEDGIPDNYRYCISEEAGHVTYHRYTPEDYTEFGFR